MTIDKNRHHFTPNSSHTSVCAPRHRRRAAPKTTTATMMMMNNMLAASISSSYSFSVHFSPEIFLFFPPSPLPLSPSPSGPLSRPRGGKYFRLDFPSKLRNLFVIINQRESGGKEGRAGEKESRKKKCFARCRRFIAPRAPPKEDEKNNRRITLLLRFFSRFVCRNVFSRREKCCAEEWVQQRNQRRAGRERDRHWKKFRQMNGMKRIASAESRGRQMKTAALRMKGFAGLVLLAHVFKVAETGVGRPRAPR